MIKVVGPLLKLFDILWLPNFSAHLPKIKGSRKEVLYKLKLLLTVFLFTHMHIPITINWWFTKFQSKIKSRQNKKSEFVSSINRMVARDGILFPISQKEKVMSWLVIAIVVQSPLPSITLLCIPVSVPGFIEENDLTDHLPKRHVLWILLYSLGVD